MAGAIIGGISGGDYSVMGSEVNEEFAKASSERLGIKVLTENKELVKNSDIVFIAVKPNQAVGVLEEISGFVTTDKLIVSICAGVTLTKIQNILKRKNEKLIKNQMNLKKKKLL